MQTIDRITRAVGLIGVLLIAAFALFACGTADSSESTATASRQVPKNSREECLIRAGAVRATTPRQLGFLERAEDADQVSRSGLIWDKVTETVVRLLETRGAEERPPAWAVWYAQPFEDDREPLEIVEEDPEDAYVLYTKKPGSRKWNRLDRCL